MNNVNLIKECINFIDEQNKLFKNPIKIPDFEKIFDNMITKQQSNNENKEALAQLEFRKYFLNYYFDCIYNKIIDKIESLYNFSKDNINNYVKIKNLLSVIYYRYFYKIRNYETATNTILPNTKNVMNFINSYNLNNINTEQLTKIYKSILGTLYNIIYINLGEYAIIKNSMANEQLLKETEIKLQYFKTLNPNKQLNQLKNIQSINEFYNQDLIKNYSNLLNIKIYKILNDLIKVLVVYWNFFPYLQSIYLTTKNKNPNNSILEKHIISEFQNSIYKFEMNQDNIDYTLKILQDYNISTNAIQNYKSKNTNHQKYNMVNILLIIHIFEKSISDYYLNKIIELFTKKPINYKNILFQIFYIIYTNIYLKLEPTNIVISGKNNNHSIKSRLGLALNKLFIKFSDLKKLNTDILPENLKNIFYEIIIFTIIRNIFVSPDKCSYNKQVSEILQKNKLL